ncbi:TPA: hypothetical protein NDT40_002795 [Klebsiella oxytoca]|nr:hypothetical protein [Klebsiella oxytoca]
MVSIEIKTATVYYSTAKKRRYLSKRGAINAEARSIIYARYPYEKPDYENGMLTYPGYCIEADEPERYQKMHRRLSKIIERNITKAN